MSSISVNISIKLFGTDMCTCHIQVISSRSTKQANVNKLNKVDGKRECWQSITHFRFCFLSVLANLFHSVFEKDLWNELFFLLRMRNDIYACGLLFRFYVF